MRQNPAIQAAGLGMCVLPIVVAIVLLGLIWLALMRQSIIQRYEWYWRSVTGAGQLVLAVLGGASVLLGVSMVFRCSALWGLRPGRYGDWGTYVTGHWDYVAVTMVLAVLTVACLSPGLWLVGRWWLRFKMRHDRSSVPDVVALEHSEVAMQRQKVVDTARKAGLVINHRTNEISPSPAGVRISAGQVVKDQDGAARRVFGVVVSGLLTASKTVNRMWSAAGCMVVPKRPGDGRVLLVGEAGSGKTVLLMAAIACYKLLKIPVVFIDGKGDQKDAEKLHRELGAEVHMGGFDFFSGTDEDLLERLMKLVPVTDSTTFYVDEARGVLKRVVAEMRGKRPRDAAEFYGWWKAAVAAEEAEIEAGGEGYLTEKAMGAIRHRRVWDTVQSRLDQMMEIHQPGGWTLPDLFKSGGVHVIPVVPESDTELFFANILLFELRRYLGRRKREGKTRPGVMVIDEFAQIVMESFSDTSASEMAAKLFETARSLDMGLWIAGQSMAGMAEGKEMQERLSSAGAAFIVGRGKNPEQEAGVFGTVFHGESTGAADGTGAKSTRAQHTYRVNPDAIRNLPNGVFFFAQGGMVRQFIALPGV